MEMMMENKTEEECVGLTLRGFSKVYYSNGRVEQRKGFSILKRKSCKGCSKCSYMKEQMEFIDMTDLGEIIDNDLYECLFDDQGDIYFEKKNE